MRSTTRMILPLLAIMSLFVGAVLMLAQSSRMDYDTLAGRLHHLKHAHAVLANVVLRVRQGHPEDLGQINTAQDQVNKEAEQLAELALRDQVVDAGLKPLLDSYAHAVAELLDHVEQFKTVNAVEHNSMHYLTQIVESLDRDAGVEGSEMRLAVERLVRAITTQVIESTAAGRADIDAKAKYLKLLGAKAPASVAAQLKSLFDHVAKVLEMQPLVDAHLGAIVTSAADKHLLELSWAVAAASDRVVERQQLMQVALIVMGAMLVGYIGALLWLLRLSVRELDAANQVLEETIEKRVAELKNKNQQLLQSQKLESIGQLAAGIAHEINTPMQFVYDNLEFLSECAEKLFEVLEVYDRNLNVTGPQRSWQERSAEVARFAQSKSFEHMRVETPKAIRESLDGILRVINIVRAMKEFSHPGQEEYVGVDVNNAVQVNATMTRNRWKYVADMEFDLAPELPTLRCVPGEVNQLLLNLIVNASDAIAEKIGPDSDALGKITVRTRSIDGRIVVVVADTGCGIPAEIRQRIFDPFFTTKDPGKGTGQGLSICYNIIVNKLHGTIDVDSTPGVGTRFTLSIPIAGNDDSEDGPSTCPSTCPESAEELEPEYSLS